MIDINHNRYSRLEIINWWDQDILKNSKVLVVGCGALGNEIIKNLAMLGVGKIFVVDMDNVEVSNLTRSVLFRKEDLGKSKAEIAAKRASEINDEIDIKFYNGSIFELGLNVFKQMDVVICGLDNREARLFVDRSCWKVNVPWIDGAIEVLSGVARMFIPPDGVDYQSTMSEVDFQLLNKRRSCLLLGEEEIQQGKVPTTPTIASVIAGIQVQEAVKFLHGRKDLLLLNGKGFHFNGANNESYIIEYQIDEESESRYTIPKFIEVEKRFDELTVEEIFDTGKKLFNSDELLLSFNNEIVYELINTETGYSKEYYKNFNLINLDDLKIGDQILKPLMVNSLKFRSELYENFRDKTTRELNFPFNDILVLSHGENEAGIVGKYFEVFS